MVLCGYRLREAENTTLREYSYEIYAYNLRELGKMKHLNLLAWQNQQATATKEKGKKTVPYFPDFKSFFDYEKARAELTGQVDVKRDEKDGSRATFLELMKNANS